MKENKPNMENSTTPLNTKEKVYFDLLDVVYKLISIRKVLYKALVVGVVIGLVMALSTPKKYTVTVTLSPEMNDTRSTGGLASMAASFLGGGLGQVGTDALNSLLAPNILSSTPFLLDLMESKVKNDSDESCTTFSTYLEEESVPWWNYILEIPRIAIEKLKVLFVKNHEGPSAETNRVISLTDRQSKKIQSLRKLIVADVNKKTTITTISITLQNPKIAAVIADSIILKLQRSITQYRISKAQDDVDYWNILYKERKHDYYVAQQEYAKYVDTNSNVILQTNLVERERLQNEMSLAYQVYSQVAQQLQMAKAKVQEHRPAFAIIEPAVVPLLPSSLSRIFIFVFSVLAVVSFVAYWYLCGRNDVLLLKELFLKYRNKMYS